METCRLGTVCWRPLCPYVHVCGCKRARRQADSWAILFMQDETDEGHIVDVPVPQIHEELADSAQIIPQERIWCMFQEPRVTAKILVVIKIPELAESPGEVRSPGIAKLSATTAATVVDTTGAKSVCEARSPGIAKLSATTAATAVDITGAKSVGAARSPGIAKLSATTAATAVDTAGAKSVGEARSPGIAMLSATTAAAAVDITGAKYVGEARSPVIAKLSATTPPQLST